MSFVIDHPIVSLSGNGLNGLSIFVNLFISIFCFHLISFLEKESRATQVGCPALSEYNRIFFLISYSVFAAAITLVVFALPPGGQQIRSFSFVSGLSFSLLG